MHSRIKRRRFRKLLWAPAARAISGGRQVRDQVRTEDAERAQPELNFANLSIVIPLILDKGDEALRNTNHDRARAVCWGRGSFGREPIVSAKRWNAPDNGRINTLPSLRWNPSLFKGVRFFMDIRALRYFTTIAELGSFTKAAVRLNVAQPALSRQVKQLEDHLGLELLLRQGRCFQLTEAGETLVRHARTIQRDFERLVEDMQARKATPAGRVAFGVPPALAHVIAPSVIRHVSEEHPAITIRVVEGVSPVLAQWLRENQIDLAVLGVVTDVEVARSQGLRVEVLVWEDMVVVEKANGKAAPPVYTRSMLEAKPLVLSQQFESMVRQEPDMGDLSLKVSWRVESMQAIKAIVLEGQVATILPVSMLHRELRDGTVTASTITRKGVRRQLTLAQPNFRQSTQATDAVIRVVRTEVDRLRNLGIFSWHPQPHARARRHGARPIAKGRAASI